MHWIDKNFRSAPELIPGEQIDIMKQCLGGGHIREMPKRRGAASASTGSNIYSKDLVFFAITSILIFWRTSPYGCLQ
jgi:hypothetical protein